MSLLSTGNRSTRYDNISHVLLINYSHWLLCAHGNAGLSEADVATKSTYEVVTVKKGLICMTLALESDIPLLDPTHPGPVPPFLLTYVPRLCIEGENNT